MEATAYRRRESARRAEFTKRNRPHFDPAAIASEIVLRELAVSPDDVLRVSWLEMRDRPPYLAVQRFHRAPDGAVYPIASRGYRVPATLAREFIEAVAAAEPHEAAWRAYEGTRRESSLPAS